MKHATELLCTAIGGSALFLFVSSCTAANAAENTAADNGTTIQEIVVTAEKRSQSINSVGATIQAITGDSLRDQGIKSVSDLSEVVPGLTFAYSGNGTPVYTLRGIGFNDQSLAAYPAVSVYVNEVPLPFPAMGEQANLDLERVEVLKGPQGTLFGQNSTGGAINFIAAKPTDTFKAGVNLSVGRFATTDIEGFVSGPLTDTLKARFSMHAVSSDDWQYSYTRPNDTIGKQSLFVGRLLLDWQPVERLKLELNLNGWLNNSDPQAGQYSALVPQIPGELSAAIDETPFAPPNDRAANWSPNNRPHQHQTQYQTSLRADYDLVSDITLTSISSYAEYRRSQTLDLDGLTQNNVDSPDGSGAINSFDQEIRLANSSTSRFRWIGGANFEHATVGEDDDYIAPDASTTPVVGFSGEHFYSNQVMENKALFANTEFDLVPAVTFKLGARYTEADRKFHGGNRDNGRGAAAFFTALADELSGTTIAPIPTGGDFVLNSITHLPGPFDDRLDEHNISYRAGVDLHVSDTTLLYVNVTKGFKAGSFPTLSAATTAGLAPVTQESVIDYEGGFKAQFLDRSLLLTGAGFFYDYTNKQVLGKIIDPVFGALSALVNVPKSHIPGGELALTWLPYAGLSLTGSATYLNAKVVDYTGVNGAGLTANFAGSPIPFTPSWQASETTEYRRPLPLSINVDAIVGATETYHSRTYSVIGTDSNTLIGSYVLLDLRAGIAARDGSWSATLWGKNVLDRYYWTNAFQQFDTIVRYAGMPATFGFSVSLRTK